MKTVVIGLLGSRLDAERRVSRWDRWRPTVSICQHEDLLVDRFELLHQGRDLGLAEKLCEDLKMVSPETTVNLHALKHKDPWDFEGVYADLHDFAQAYEFDPEQERYLVHITTGTHVAQICLFLLAESRHLPASLLQSSPPRRGVEDAGGIQIIDLDLSKYDRIASRFARDHEETLSFLKSGIETRNESFNNLIEQIERVAIRSRAPMLLTGPTGAGKSLLASRVYQLKRSRAQLSGDFIEVNCATLRGDTAMSTLFGHVRGSFTGAEVDRPGLLMAADKGIIFLDEIGELGLDEQAMLLRAIEEKSFLPVGADEQRHSDFQLIAGTNRNLHQHVKDGAFREDLLARINIWTFDMPGLRNRREDIEPNLHYELGRYAGENGARITFNKEALKSFLDFANTPGALWSGNFRDLNAAVTRMSTLATGGRINLDGVRDEIERLQLNWQGGEAGTAQEVDLAEVMGASKAAELDRFDRVQLAEVVRTCRSSKSLSEAGRELFSVSRQKKKSINDADRIRKYLARFDLDWDSVID